MSFTYQWQTLSIWAQNQANFDTTTIGGIMIAEIKAEIEKRHLLKHPFYQAWMAGELTRDELADYATQYSLHVDHFPRYLSAIHSQCESATDRQMILENLNDEEGVGYEASHPELWLRFAEGMGVNRQQVDAAQFRAAITRVKDTFMELARSSFYEGLGALYAYESQVPEIAGSKIEGLKKWYGIDDGRTLEFFYVHQTADIQHREVIEKILANGSLEQREHARVAAARASQSLWDFLSDIRSGIECVQH